MASIRHLLVELVFVMNIQTVREVSFSEITLTDVYKRKEAMLGNIANILEMLHM